MRNNLTSKREEAADCKLPDKIAEAAAREKYLVRSMRWH
jgi:hypothetical protein